MYQDDSLNKNIFEEFNHGKDTKLNIDASFLRKKKTDALLNSFIIHYFYAVSCYMYMKSFEQCHQKKYDCDLYNDKYTILSKLILLLLSGLINGFLIIFSI